MERITNVTSKLIIDMGESWYKAFEKEFSKAYFQKVLSNSFIIKKKNIKFLFVYFNS